MQLLQLLITILITVSAVVSFDDDKKMNPILRHFAHQTRAKPLMHALTSTKVEEGGYRNCYLSPIQCHLPVRRETQQIPSHMAVSGTTLDEDDMIRLRRMLFPMS